MFKFSRVSTNRLSNCHKDLKKLMVKSLELSIIDFGISCGYRSIEEQQEIYQQGRTKPGGIVTYVDGVKKKSKHNELPSLAVDIYAYVNGKAVWDKEHLYYLGGVIMTCARQLDIQVRWGANFNQNQNLKDENFYDLPHFELL